MRDADLILTPSHLLVVMAFTEHRAWLRPLLQHFDRAEVALPLQAPVKMSSPRR
jgi:hypothetical protein